jgi:RNA polymerase sigma factor (sigma-70 family)
MTEARRQLDDTNAGFFDEAALMRRIALEDRRAFEALYRLYYTRLRRFIDKMTRQPALIDEILDDTMLVVWKKAQTFDHSCRVSTWVFAVAYRTALKALGKERKHQAGDEGQDDPPEAISEEPGPDAVLFTEQSRRMLDHLLGQLSAEHRAVIELTYFHGHAYGDIALIANCPEGTVKTRMFHARRKLRELLIKEGWEGA